MVKKLTPNSHMSAPFLQSSHKARTTSWRKCVHAHVGAHLHVDTPICICQDGHLCLHLHRPDSLTSGKGLCHLPISWTAFDTVRSAFIQWRSLWTRNLTESCHLSIHLSPFNWKLLHWLDPRFIQWGLVHARPPAPFLYFSSSFHWDGKCLDHFTSWPFIKRLIA